MGIEKSAGSIRNTVGPIQEGKPKSGRTWKIKQLTRFSTQNRQGVLSHLSKSYEEKQAMKERRENIKALEQRMKDEKKEKGVAMRELREARKKQRMANEYKNAQYQIIKPEKIKNMSKKQLRMIKKTAMNKNGQVELVNPWTNQA